MTVKVMCMAVDVLEHLTTSVQSFHSLPAATINPPYDWRRGGNEGPSAPGGHTRTHI